MDKGAIVYRAYASGTDGRFYSWVDQGVVTEVVKDGVPLVALNGKTLCPLDDRWHLRRADAQREIYRQMVRFIGEMQAKADSLSDEILHADLASEEVPA